MGLNSLDAKHNRRTIPGPERGGFIRQVRGCFCKALDLNAAFVLGRSLGTCLCRNGNMQLGKAANVYQKAEKAKAWNTLACTYDMYQGTSGQGSRELQDLCRLTLTKEAQDEEG